MVIIAIFQMNTMVGQIEPIGPIIAQLYEWTKSMGDFSSDAANAVAVDALGNVYSTGFFQGTVDFDPDTIGIHELDSEGSYDIFVLKLDALGNFVWAKNMGGTEADSGHAISVDEDSNVYITGYFTNTADFDPDEVVTYTLFSEGEEDIFVSKLDASGNFIWAKHLGGPFNDKGNSIALDNLGAVYTTGFFQDTADFNPDAVGTYDLSSEGSTDIFISKLDSSGDFVTAIKIGGPEADVGNSIALDVSGNIYTTGYFEDTVDFDPSVGVRILVSDGDKDIFVSKLDNNLLFRRGKRMGGIGQDVGNGITVGPAGNVYTTGFFEDTADFDPQAFLSHNLTSLGGLDIFVSKLSSSINFRWAKRMGDSGLDTAFAISIDAAGKVYTTGYFSETVDFNPGPGTHELDSDGSTDIFISKLSASGNYIWAKRMGGDGSDSGNSIRVSENLSVYTVGGFDDIVDFHPGTAIDEFVSEGFGDIFIQKLSIPTFSFPSSSSSPAKVFPNPTSDKVTLDLGRLFKRITLNVKNFNGELISTHTYKNKEEINFKIEDNPGIYFVEIVVNGGKYETLKIIKE